MYTLVLVKRPQQLFVLTGEMDMSGCSKSGWITVAVEVTPRSMF